MQADTALTVSELNEYVRRMLAADPILRGIRLRGEISNMKRHASGHLYFALKDEQCRIACVMYRQDAVRLRFDPADGMRVTLEGSAALYAQGGAFQFYTYDMQLAGTGDWYLRYERIKQALYAQGLFDASLKRPLPESPRVIGIVTSGTGSVLHDIIQIGWRRNPGQIFLLHNTLVQGENAAADICRALNEIACAPGVDVVIVGRGGGSIEDLWPFNEECVARAIRACPVPVVSAVGHETDVTIADFSADKRAPTPSAAAEMCVPERSAMLDTLTRLHGDMQQAAHAALDARERELSHLITALQAASPDLQLQKAIHECDRLTDALQSAARHALTAMESELSALTARLSALNPSRVLSRGFAYVTRDEKPLDSVTQISEGDALSLLMHDGDLDVRATRVTPRSRQLR